MEFRLAFEERRALRHASLFAPSCDVRRRAAILIHLADGRRLAPLALAAGVSRPTVYLWARVFLHFRTIASLDPRGIKHRGVLANAHRRASAEGSTDVSSIVPGANP